MSDIKLRLDGENEEVELKPVEYKEKIQIDQSIKFSPEEEKQIDDFSQKIDLEDSNIIPALELKKRFQISQKKL